MTERGGEGGDEEPPPRPCRLPRISRGTQHQEGVAMSAVMQNPRLDRVWKGGTPGAMRHGGKAGRDPS